MSHHDFLSKGNVSNDMIAFSNYTVIATGVTQVIALTASSGASNRMGSTNIGWRSNALQNDGRAPATASLDNSHFTMDSHGGYGHVRPRLSVDATMIGGQNWQRLKTHRE
jgi:hypothetical protein